jgi:hypothetical protein
MFECSIPVNKYLAPETINGNCTAYFYTNDDQFDDAGGLPVIYSDNTNTPNTLKSANESFIDFTVNTPKPKGWRSGTFSTNGSISSGSSIWFGCFTMYIWFPRFDYGGEFYNVYWDDDEIPATYPEIWYNWNEGFKLSMYFDYPPAAQNYLRTLTQGVTLNDTQRLTGNYKRSSAQTVGVNSILQGFKCFFCIIQEIVRGITCNDTSIVFLRSMNERITTDVKAGSFRTFYRSLFNHAQADGEVRAGRIQFTKITDGVHAAGAVLRGLVLFVRIASGVFIRDYLLSRFLKSKSELVLKSAVTREIILESKIN